MRVEKLQHLRQVADPLPALEAGMRRVEQGEFPAFGNQQAEDHLYQGALA